MKKIIFLLLCAVSSYGQVSTGQEQEFDYGIKNNASQTVTSPTYLVTNGTDGTYGKVLTSNLSNVAPYASAINLPVTGEDGKIYITKDNNKLYRWTGVIYQELAVTDISSKENISNKQNNLAVDGTGAKYPTVDAVNTLKDYTKEITVGSGGTYETLELLFANEPSGKTLINLIDAEYNCTNPQFVVKTGWILQGQGYGKTNLTFNFTAAIDPNLSGLQIRTDCELVDFKVTSINNTNLGGFSQYALHSDYVGAFTAKITRCWFKTVASPNVVDASGYNGLAVGIGTWEGQVLEFHESILQGQSVSIDNRYTLNLHNTFISGVHVVPSRVSFYNSQLTGGFTTVLISDTYSNSSESDSSRIKDLFEFVGCEIKGGIYLRSANQIGGTDRKNGLAFNFSGSNVDEFINVGEIVNTSLSNYDVTSLPITKDIDFQKNLGASAIMEGDFVSYVYANRVPEYHRPEVIITPIGIEKLNSTNVKYFAGISLTNSNIGNFAHIAKGAIAYTKDAFSDIEIGAKLAFNDTGVLVKSSISGIGTVIKKTTDNRLGIFLTPNGRKENTIGSYSERGLLQIRGNAGGDGQPSIFLEDKNNLGEFTNYAISAGSNSNAIGSATVEKGRFSINDNIAARERYAINSTGNSIFDKKIIISSNVEITDDASQLSLPDLSVFGKNKTIGSSPIIFANLQINSKEEQGANIGGSLGFGGKYNSVGDFISFAKISGKKENSITGSFDSYISFEISNNTLAPYIREVLKISSTGAATFSSLSGTDTRIVTAAADGTLEATTAVNSRPYKVYTALLTQSGTNAPVATVLENTFGGTVVLSRNSTGVYIGTLTGAFTVNKTHCSGIASTHPSFLSMDSSNVNSFSVTTETSAGVVADGYLVKTPIEVRVYNFIFLLVPYSMLRRRKRKQIKQQ